MLSSRSHLVASGGGGRRCHAPPTRFGGSRAAVVASARSRSLLCSGSSSSANAQPEPARARPAAGAALFARRSVLGGLLPICACPACANSGGGSGGGGGGSGGGTPGAEPTWYQRYFACAMGTQMGTYEALIRPTKERLFAEFLGSGGALAPAAPGEPLRLLEVGIGAGPNLALLTAALAQSPSPPPRLLVTGLDPNPAMQRWARASAAAAGLADDQLALAAASAEAMPFPDGAFDGAVITLVLCSVPDPVKALTEVRRVVRPGGKVCVIEHVAAPPSQPLLALGQRVLEPLQRALADGCHLTRDTHAAFAKARFDAAGLESFEVPGLSILAPHLAGIVTV